MAATWSGGSTNYTNGTDTTGSINTLAPIPSTKYTLIKGMSWNPSSGNRAIFSDIYGYAERTSETTATVYLCQRAWIYTTRAANYAACMEIANNVRRTSSGYMWGYNTYQSLSVGGTSLGNIRYGSSSNTATPAAPYGGSLYLNNTGRSWWRQLSTITDIPITAQTTSITLDFGALSGTYSGYNWEGTTAAWTHSFSILPMTAHVKVNGVWKAGLPWVKVNGVWHQGIPWVKVNGVWKKI